MSFLVLLIVAQMPQPAFPQATEPDAWARLPRENPPLPAWAKSLVGPLPKTTAKLLELDYLHREKNPLGTLLAARLRREVADALGNKFGVAEAEADLRRMWPVFPGERDVVAVAFARKLTLEGHAITDAEFAEVLKLFDTEQTTAIVHTVAYANFKNRLVLGLGATGDPVPALDVKFDMQQLAKVPVPARPPWDDLKAVTANGPAVRVEWSKAKFDELNTSLEKQQERKLRIPLPDPAVFEKLPQRERDGAAKIRWNTVSVGYQPEMTRAWFAPLYALYEEAKVDRVFTNSVFWVVTRTNDCFY